MADAPQVPGGSGPLAQALGSMQLGAATPVLPSCRECRKEVSANAASCPHCGAPTPTKKQWNGWGYEWRSKAELFGFPIVHVAIGRDARGRLRVAKGVIAVGQFGIGLITVAQLGVGLLFGVGQCVAGLIALGQFAFALYFGVGQFAIGYIAIGQFALGYYGWAQVGFAKFIWSLERSDPQAIAFFRDLAAAFGRKPGQ